MSRRAAALYLVVSLLLSGCAMRGDNADKDRQGGFYGGVSGGISRP